MKKIYTLIIATAFCFSANAQTPIFTWAKQMGAVTGSGEGDDIVIDFNNNVITMGVFTGTVDFDPGVGTFNLTAAGSFDIFVSKLDASGNFVWAKRIGGVNTTTGRSIATDGTGNIYITGDFSGTVDFDPNIGTFNLTSSGGSSDIFIGKLDGLGNLVWAKQIGGTAFDQGRSIALDGSGNVYTTGFFSNIVDFDPGVGTFNMTSAGSYDIFISKFDASGNYVWAKRMGSTSVDAGDEIAIDGSGNVYTTGVFLLTVDFNPGVGTFNMTDAGGGDVFISKLDASGNFVWAKRMGGTGSDEGQSISLDALGNVYTSGFFSGTADFDPSVGTFNLVSGGMADIFISKVDASGNFVWAKAMGGTGDDWSYYIALDALGFVYTTGLFNATADFDPGIGTFNLTSVGNQDIFISKLDAAGNYIWAGAIGGTGLDQGNSLAFDPSLNIYTTGYFSATSDFDAGIGVFNMTPASPSEDVFVAKYCPGLPAQPSSITGPALVCNGSTNTYSIPAITGATSYTWNLPGGWTGTSTTTSINATASATSGTISVTANNACGSSTAQTLTVTVNNVGVTTAFIPVACNGGNSGSATATPSGTGPFTYLWSNSQTTATATGLVANTYTVTVTGAGGCTAQTTVTVTQPTVLSLSQTHTNNLCFGNCIGTVTLTPSGGTAGYTYSGATSGLCAGTYTFTVTDANGCTAQTTATITTPTTIVATATATTPTFCIGGCTNLNINASGGTPNYSYVWMPGNMTTATPNVCPTITTTYTCIVTDANACTKNGLVTVTVNQLPVVTTSATSNNACVNWTTDALTGTPNGGAFTGTAVTGNNFDPSVAGAGTFTITYTYTDGNGCTNTATTNINVGLCTGIGSEISSSTFEVYPNPFDNMITIRSANLNETAVAEIFNMLGEKIYSTQITNPQTEIDLSQIESGIYFIKITTSERSVTKKIVKE